MEDSTVDWVERSLIRDFEFNPASDESAPEEDALGPRSQQSRQNTESSEIAEDAASFVVHNQMKQLKASVEMQLEKVRQEFRQKLREVEHRHAQDKQAWKASNRALKQEVHRGAKWCKLF